MALEEQIARALTRLSPNPKAYWAGMALASDFKEARTRLKPGGEGRLAEALVCALKQLERDDALALFILSDLYRQGFTLGLGSVDHTTAFLAAVEAGYVWWALEHGGIRFTLADFYDMPAGFRGDLKDAASAIMGWTMN